MATIIEIQDSKFEHLSEYADKVAKMLTEKGIRNTVDKRNEKMG